MVFRYWQSVEIQKSWDISVFEDLGLTACPTLQNTKYLYLKSSISYFPCGTGTTLYMWVCVVCVHVRQKLFSSLTLSSRFNFEWNCRLALPALAHFYQVVIVDHYNSIGLSISFIIAIQVKIYGVWNSFIIVLLFPPFFSFFVLFFFFSIERI